MSGSEDIASLQKAAEAGDPNAQYQLGAALHARRQLDASLHWIERAANSGHQGAQYTFGAFALSGAVPLKAVSGKLAPLKAAAAGGVVQAQRLMSVVCAWGLTGQEDWPSAVRYLLAAAQGGDAGAMREAAVLQCMAAGDIGAGASLLYAAAQRGDPLAAAWSTSAPSSTPIDWIQVERDLLAMPDERADSAEPLCPAPKARVIRKFFRDFECDYLCTRAARLVQPSQVVNETTGKGELHPDRSSSTIAFWPVQDDLVIHRLTRRMASAAELSWRYGEILNVMRYEAGQQYKPHFDFFNDSAVETPVYRDEGGQRVRTVLVYLNEGYRGGETHFIPANVRFKGATGDALIFDNVDENGAPDRASLHAGRPVTEGVKWLASKWFRAGPHW